MKRMVFATLAVSLSGIVFAGCTAPTTQSTSLSQPETSTKPAVEQVQSGKESMKQLSDFETIDATQVVLETDKGTVTIDLYRDKAPITTANFLQLVKDGFYDGIKFHRVIPGFMAQMGDPLSKDESKKAQWGTGGPGYVIPDEFDPSLKHDAAGVLSMANRGPNTGGSQIFITYGPQPHLDGVHAVFGKVSAGLDVVESLTNGDAIISARYQ